MPTGRPATVFPWRRSLAIRPAPRRLLTSTPQPHASSRRRISRSLNNEALQLSGPSLIHASSPRYIDVPTSQQPQAPERTRLKGILPAPRNIFAPRRPRSRHASPVLTRLAQLASETRRPRPTEGVPPALAAYNAAKTRAAAKRRENLALGLTALSQRADLRASRAAALRSRREAERKALLARPAPADEALTRSSVAAVMLPPRRATQDLPDAGAGARLAERAARVQARTAERAEATRADLHELYMHARRFIVNEAQLDAALEAEFGTQAAPRAWGSQATVWADGRPPTLQTLADEAEKARGGGVGRAREKDRDAREKLMRSRLQRIAEELTGGKM